jgi:phage RecT family recombinase
MAQAQRQQRAGQGRGNAPRQGTGQQQGPRTENQVMTFEQRAHEVLVAVGAQRALIEQVLPRTIGFDNFLATMQTAFRHNPDILRCTTASIVQAVCKAAYDGLQLDNREAALVPQWTKVKDPDTDKEKSKRVARYNPMVAGLRKQIIQGGLVDDLQVVCVFEGEPYRAIRGTMPTIEHEEKPEKRGNDDNIVAVYSVAWLKNGRVNFETMNREQVNRIRAIAATDYVWDKNFHEMARKTCLRRHRKGLPGINEIRDAEMQILFPQFDQTLAADVAPALPKPDRRDFGATGAAPALGAPEVHLNAFSDFDRRVDEQFAEAAEEEGRKPAAAKAAAAKPPPAKESGGDADEAGTSDTAERPAVHVPDSPEAWEQWAVRVESDMARLTDQHLVGALWDESRDLIDLAPKTLGDRVDQAFRDHLIDIAGDEDDASPAQPSLDIDQGEEN